MHKHTLSFTLLTLVATLLLFVQPACSASIKDNMANRLPQITKMKNQGVFGENNKGYLDFRGAKKNEGLLHAENKDRAAVYKAIAKKQGASADLVGKRRAKMIAQKGKAGQWFQKQDGSWYKK